MEVGSVSGNFYGKHEAQGLKILKLLLSITVLYVSFGTSFSAKLQVLHHFLNLWSKTVHFSSMSVESPHHEARWPAACVWMDCRAGLNGTAAWAASLGHRCPPRRGLGRVGEGSNRSHSFLVADGADGEWRLDNLHRSSISANFQSEQRDHTTDCFRKTIAMSAVSSTFTQSCRSVLRWPVLIEGNQEGVMMKAGF